MGRAPRTVAARAVHRGAARAIHAHMKFRVPREDPPPVLVELVERAWPEATRDDCYTLVGKGGVKVDERVVKNPRRSIEPDALVEIEDATTDEEFGLPDAEELARSDDWVVVDKPAGMSPDADPDDPMSAVKFLADVIGMDRDTFTPVWPLPTNASGPWMCAEDDTEAKRIRTAIADGSMISVWVAIAPKFGLPTGEIEHDGFGCRYATIRMRGGLAEIQLMPEVDDPAQVARLPEMLLDLLAEQGAAVLGDRDRGGYMISGGLRLRLMSLYDDEDLSEGWVPPDAWWPEEPVVPQIEHPEPERKPSGIRKFSVSTQTLKIVGDGHPWVLPDRDTSPLEQFDPGEPVQLTGPRGEPGPFALVDGTGDIAARVWSDDEADVADFHGEVGFRLDEAFARRVELYRGLAHTNLFRVIHGEADGFPGFILDSVGPLYRATLVGSSCRAFRDQVYEAISDGEPDAMILEVPHLRDVRETDDLPSARIVHHGAHYARPGDRVIGLEDDLKYWCEPWAGIDVGFFADQRDNRRRAVELVNEGRDRWLNLFCHTGAYSVALVAAGAEVVSVDISSRYLEWLDQNLELNDLDLSKNTNEAVDAREYVDAAEGTFDGIIVDPPTAARSDAGFWSVKSDYEDLLVACFDKLSPGGAMLVCRNARKRVPTLEELVRGAAKKAGVELDSLQEAPPAADYPRVDAFPEGDSFEGVWVVRS